MADVLTPEQRRKCMASIKGKDTKPELIVRKIVHAMGFRYRLHVKNLPGKPDMVLPQLGKVIFVHGCFWHMHTCRFGRVKPMTNPEFWQKKRESNQERDSKNIRELKKLDWKVMIIWECRTKNFRELEKRLWNFLG